MTGLLPPIRDGMHDLPLATGKRPRRMSHDTMSVSDASIAESVRSTIAIRALRRPYLAGGYCPPPPVGNPAAWDLGTGECQGNKSHTFTTKPDDLTVLRLVFALAGLRMQRLPTHAETAYLQQKQLQELPNIERQLPNIERRYATHIDDAAGQWFMPIRGGNLRKRDVRRQNVRRAPAYGHTAYGSKLQPMPRRSRASQELPSYPMPDLSYRHISYEVALPTKSLLPPLTSSTFVQTGDVGLEPPAASPLPAAESPVQEKGAGCWESAAAADAGEQ